MTNLKDKKNIIFDLGNVIIDIDLNIMYKRFRTLGFEENGEFLNKYEQIDFFSDFEKGRITSEQFIEQIKCRMPKGVSDLQILQAWNAILLGYKTDRIETLIKLKQTHNLYLLSNTNELHISVFEKNVPMVGSLEKLFDKVYYSCQMHMNKPNENIFLAVLEDANIKAEDTLFLDDSPANVKTAENLGIESWLVEDPNAWVPKINTLIEKILI